MNIITQLTQFILLKRDVKDIDYSPVYAICFFLMYTALLLLLAYQINTLQAPEKAELQIEYFPYACMAFISIGFHALYYVLFAAQQKQARFVQAITAFNGCSVLLIIIGSLAATIPGGALIALFANGVSFACNIRVTMQSLDYSLIRALFTIIGISLLSIIIAMNLFPPVVAENIAG